MTKFFGRIVFFFAVSVVVLTPSLLKGEYYPIIFVHGIEGDANNEIGWEAWGNHPLSAMKRIKKSAGVYNQKMRYISYLFYDIMRKNMAWSQMWLTGSVRTKVGLSDSA